MKDGLHSFRAEAMPSLKQYLQRLGLRGLLSDQNSDGLQLALRDLATNQKRAWKELEKLRKVVDRRLALNTDPLAGRGTMAGILERLHRRGPRFETVLDIGASDGRWTKMAMEAFPQQRYLLIEAQPVHQAALARLAEGHANVEVVMAAAGECRGEVYFDSSDPFGGQASTNPDASTHLTKLPVTTLDHEVFARNLPSPFLIKFDTHGFELPILNGAARVLEQTAVIIMECYNFEIGSDCLLFPEMCIHLRKSGFRCIDMADVMYRDLDEALWQMDLVFIRADRDEFRRNSFR